MKQLLLLAALATPSVAFAHPGHGVTPAESIVHFLVEPQHAVLMLTLALAVLLSWRTARD